MQQWQTLYCTVHGSGNLGNLSLSIHNQARGAFRKCRNSRRETRRDAKQGRELNWITNQGEGLPSWCSAAELLNLMSKWQRRVLITDEELIQETGNYCCRWKSFILIVKNCWCDNVSIIIIISDHVLLLEARKFDPSKIQHKIQCIQLFTRRLHRITGWFPLWYNFFINLLSNEHVKWF